MLGILIECTKRMFHIGSENSDMSRTERVSIYNFLINDKPYIAKTITQIHN